MTTGTAAVSAQLEERTYSRVKANRRGGLFDAKSVPFQPASNNCGRPDDAIPAKSRGEGFDLRAFDQDADWAGRSREPGGSRKKN